MTGHNDRYNDIEVDVLDEAVRAVINNALAQAECTWEELQEQAKAAFPARSLGGPGSSYRPLNLASLT